MISFNCIISTAFLEALSYILNNYIAKASNKEPLYGGFYQGGSCLVNLQETLKHNMLS